MAGMLSSFFLLAIRLYRAGVIVNREKDGGSGGGRDAECPPDRVLTARIKTWQNEAEAVRRFQGGTQHDRKEGV
jgi:hypothetical protein